MAKRLSDRDRLGNKGESFVISWAAEMEGLFSKGGEKTPSIDGVIHLHDAERNTNIALGVQIKTGESYVNRRSAKRGYYWLRVNRQDMLDWHSGNLPVIVVWVNWDSDPTKRYALWCNPRFSKPGTSKIKLPIEHKCNSSSASKLITLIRIHSRQPSIPLLSAGPLYPTKVSDIKPLAWQFYRSWQATGSNSPVFGHVKVTRNCWRHITRVSKPQRSVIHRLALLPAARELLEKATRSRFLRILKPPGLGCERTLRGICGVYRKVYQADVMVEAIVEVTNFGGRKQVKLYAIHEKRNWFG